MNTLIGKLSRLAHWNQAAPTTPPPISSADAKLVDTAAWYEEHAQLCFELQAAAIRAAHDPKAKVELQQAQSALLAHAAIITDGSGPVLFAKDGIHTIPFERLAEARAKIKLQEAENARLRSSGGTGPCQTR
ncbi:hypothetical protein RP29_06220 [Acidovorax temperans]|uniref:Uncharacterized protein n=1 Tax=Acidovorax temperans TaxID=80878 RepID=A0A0D7KDP2_9BURK|nr:hypothetical protein [Acidovorax temperans]KJA11313.1 hypothetical protein RP29_06220 [Acidovorax temperans]